MSPVEFAAWLLLGMLAFWLLGGIVARVSGLLLVLTGAANLALDPGVGAALLIVLGAVTWLARHWRYALRHHSYKSLLARHMFCRWAPEWLDATRDWAVAVAPEATDDEGRRDAGGRRRMRLRRCHRERSRPRQEAPAQGALGHRVTEQVNTIDVALLRGFLKRALEDDAVADAVNDLLFKHVVAGRYHPSVVAETLPSCVDEILGAAKREDW